MAFEIDLERMAGAPVQEEIQAVANQQYNNGDMLAVTAGVAALVTAAGKGTHLFGALQVPADKIRPGTMGLATTVGEVVNAALIEGGDVRVKSDLRGNSAPPINGLPCNANASLTSLLVTQAGGAANDFLNGQCYVPEIGQQRLITADAYGANIHTFTVAPAFRRAPTTGDTVIAVPFSKGAYGIKFNATTPSQGLDTSVAGKTGGTNKIEDVDLVNLKVSSSCPNKF